MSFFKGTSNLFTLGALMLFLGPVSGAMVYAISNIIEKVQELITRTNIGQMVRDALQKAKKNAAQKAIGGAVSGIVVDATSHSVTVDIFDEDTQEKTQVKLNTTVGVDKSIVNGMPVSIAC